MIRVAIVEDDEAERQKIRDNLNYVMDTEQTALEVDTFSTGLAFIGRYTGQYDIVLMDIDMPGMNGMETAKALRKVDQAVILIFVTNMAQYAISGYEVDALDFILKPVNRYSFAIKMRRAIARTAKVDNDVIQVKKEGVAHLVRLSQIRYLEVTGHYVIYHTVAGDYSEYTTLKEARKKVNHSNFVQCSQSFLINLRYIDAVTRETVTVAGNEISISRKMRADFLNAVTDFLGGKAP